MYDLFSEPVNSRGGGLVIPQFRRVRDGMNQNIERVRAFYQNNPGYMNNSHFLIRLLLNLNISHDYDDDVFVGKVEDWAMDLSMSLKMPSSIFRGGLFTPGPFYGGNVSEAVIAHTEPFDIAQGAANWADLQPIRILRHPFADVDMALPNGKPRNDEEGFAVIAINLPMLALQYKHWRKWERITNAMESPRSAMQFLHSFPIPNALYTQTNAAILNRIINRFNGVPNPKARGAHSFYIPNWGREVDDSIESYFNHISRKSLSFNEQIAMMPAVGKMSMMESIELPGDAYTAQIQWAVVLARKDLVGYLVRQNFDFDNKSNMGTLNKLRRYLNLVEINRSIEHAMPRDKFVRVYFEIVKNIRPYLQ